MSCCLTSTWQRLQYSTVFFSEGLGLTAGSSLGEKHSHLCVKVAETDLTEQYKLYLLIYSSLSRYGKRHYKVVFTCVFSPPVRFEMCVQWLNIHEVYLFQASMALSLSSPCGCPYDEDEEIAVFESTAAEHGGPARPRLPEISVISPGLDTRPSITESVRVYRSMLLFLCSPVQFS